MINAILGARYSSQLTWAVGYISASRLAETGGAPWAIAAEGRSPLRRPLWPRRRFASVKDSVP